MDQLLSEHVNKLKSALLRLNATGEQGFEGLISATLREITGVPFRLAGSGRQFGIDGKNSYEEDGICFEGKRYVGDIPRAEVITKIADLARNNSYPDLVWVLGATSPVKTQLADDARADGRTAGISVFILDWSETDLPPLAVALAMGRQRVEEFLKANLQDHLMLQNALAALEAVKADPEFTAHAQRIKAELDVPAIATALAQEANARWLTEGFSNKKSARDKFGQPLCPGDTASVKILLRKSLTDELQPIFSRPPDDDQVVFVLGGEGCGKSWIIAQSWLELQQKPLMIIFSPDEFQEAAEQNDIRELLIAKLIKQTGDDPMEINRQRWCRRFRQWNRSPNISSPRLIVTIDGINQKPNADWGLIIDKTSATLKEIGGRLIITTRTPYFQDRVIRRLSVPKIEFKVPEWLPGERDEVLRNYGFKPGSLHAAVAQSLLNPRLLGIAVELLDKEDVAALEELSVSRLLFEHIRASERNSPAPQPADVFVHRLRKHAQTILERKQQMQEDDLNIFEAETQAVADGRFFLPVEGDPGKYQLKSDGLTLALGFSVVDLLQVAKRNGRDLDGKLAAILDPIGSLDTTADVVLAALTVTLVEDNSYAPAIAAALVKGFASLQNPDQTKFPVFTGLIKIKPLPFMNAAHDLCLQGADQQNFDWIRSALIEASKSLCLWPEIANEIRSWLSLYSLSPDLGMCTHPVRDPVETVQAEREKNQQLINQKVDKFSLDERNILNRLQQAEGDLNALSRLGLYLLAGKPLSTFADCFINWSFSTALNSDYAAPHKEMKHLVSLNRVDWRETQMALLKASEVLRGSNVSSIGKCALVTVLLSTGDAGDDEDAQALIAELRNDPRRFKGWRLVENYCATDPCDPASTEPENITQTMEKYRAIDVTQLKNTLGVTSEDDFFAVARPGMARFKSDVAVAKHCEFAENVLTRNGFPLRQGIFELLEHNVLLTSVQAHSLVRRWRELKPDGMLSGLTEQDRRIVSQYHLLLAFPFLNAYEQVEILLSIEKDEPVLSDLINRMSPLDELSFERLLGEAIKSGDEYKQYLLLMTAKLTNTPLSAGTRNSIATFVNAESDRLRAEALGVIAHSGDSDMLTITVHSDWNAANIKTENRFEEWYGSSVLLKAAVKDLIGHLEVLDRISPRLYGRAAKILNIEAKQEIARRIDESIKYTIEIEDVIVAPYIELEVSSDNLNEPNRFKLNDGRPSTQDLVETLRRFHLTIPDYEERQRRNYEIFNDFKNSLTKAKAGIILDNLKLDEFTVIVATDDENANKWYKLFMALPDSKLSAVHNLIFLLAYTLCEKEPDKAKALFNKVRDNRPLVRFTFGSVGVELAMMTIWAGGRNAVLDEQRTLRLDQAETDYDLSLEVLAGLMNGQRKFLEQYISKKLSREEPAEIARGLMVAGFSDDSEFNSEVLSRYENCAGLIGSAGKAAKYAYERNCWARHWFEKMSNSVDSNEFWSSSVLFNKIVDGRYAVWHDEYPRVSALIKSYRPDTGGRLNNRYNRWKAHREKKLFGNEAPAKIFLHGTE
jgi:hypothetical protein